MSTGLTSTRPSRKNIFGRKYFAIGFGYGPYRIRRKDRAEKFKTALSSFLFFG